MAHDRMRSASLLARGARYQFGIGVALLAVIPVLVIWYVASSGHFGDGDTGWRDTVLALIALAVAAGGYLVLRKYPVNIIRLRGYVEGMVRGELPDQIDLIRGEDDITSIEKCMNLLVDRLRGRVETVENEKEALQEQLYRIQKMESLGLLASGIAHDFNNILTAVLGQTDLVALDVADNDEALETIGDIKSAIRRAMDLTDQLLTYAGKGRMERGPVDVSEAVAEMRKLLRVSVPKGIELKYELASDLCPVRGDRGQMAQVVMNLVHNAADAIGDGPGEIVCSTGRASCSEEDLRDAYPRDNVVPGRYLYLAVSDTGSGMDKETKERIFDPFYTTKSDGRGLGLAVVLGIVKSHGGVMIVDSDPGAGATFRCLLPCTGEEDG